MRGSVASTRWERSPPAIAAGGVAHAVEREQADPHDDPAGAAEQQQHGGDHDALDHQQPLELLVGLAQRDGGDQGPAGPRVALGEHAVAAVRRRRR